MQPIIPLETLPVKAENKYSTKEANDTDSFLSHLNVSHAANSDESDIGENFGPDKDPIEISRNEAEPAPDGAVTMESGSPSADGAIITSKITEELLLSSSASAVPQTVSAHTAETDNSLSAVSRMTEVHSAKTDKALLLQVQGKPAHPVNHPNIVLEPGKTSTYYSADQLKTLGNSTDLQFVTFTQTRGIESISPPVPQGDTASGTMDPRFTEILSKTTGFVPEIPPDPVSLRQSNASNNMVGITQTGSDQEAFLKITNLSLSGNDMGGGADSNAFASQTDGLTPPHIQAAAQSDPVDTFAVAAHSRDASQVTQTSRDSAAIRLPSRVHVAENQIVDQVIEQVSIKSFKETSNLTIKMQPEELGRLEMELVMNKDSIKAYIRAQTPQVQEVLEKHLFRLREGFEQQGVKVDEIHVSVNSEQNDGPGLFQDRHAPHSPSPSADITMAQDFLETDTNEIALMHNRTDGRISLRI